MTYARPSTVSAAVEMLRNPGIAVLAGGTTLVDLMRCGVTNPAGLADISRLPELRTAADNNGRLRLGACLTMAEVARNTIVAQRFPAVRDALLLAASAQIRNQATVAGNLRQGPRCVFYRDHRAPCTRRDSRQSCSARGATTITPPLLGADEDCAAPYPGDLAVALVAHRALVEVRSQDGSRFLAVEELLKRTHPGHPDALTTGELIVSIIIPQDGCASAFVKRRERRSFAFASASAAAALELADGVVRTARVVIGAQSTRPRRVPEAEQVVIGQAAEPLTFQAAADAAVSGMRGPDREIDWCRATIAQALNEAADRATDVAD